MSTDQAWFRQEVVIGAVRWMSQVSVDPNEGSWTFKATGPSGRFAQGKLQARDLDDRSNLAELSLRRATQMTWIDPKTGGSYTLDLRPTPPARVTVRSGDQVVGIIELPPGRLLPGLSDQELSTILTRAQNQKATHSHRQEGEYPNDHNH